MLCPGCELPVIREGKQYDMIIMTLLTFIKAKCKVMPARPVTVILECQSKVSALEKLLRIAGAAGQPVEQGTTDVALHHDEKEESAPDLKAATKEATVQVLQKLTQVCLPLTKSFRLPGVDLILRRINEPSGSSLQSR